MALFKKTTLTFRLNYSAPFAFLTTSFFGDCNVWDLNLNFYHFWQMFCQLWSTIHPKMAAFIFLNQAKIFASPNHMYFLALSQYFRWGNFSVRKTCVNVSHQSLKAVLTIWKLPYLTVLRQFIQFESCPDSLQAECI